MAKRIYLQTYVERYTPTVEVALFDSQYSGDPQLVDAEAPFFSLSYDEQPSLTEPFMASALTAYFLFTSENIATDATLIDDLLTSADASRFELKMYIGLDLVWEGKVEVGVIQYEEGKHGAYPLVIPVTAACGINSLKSKYFDRYAPNSALGDTLSDKVDYLLNWSGAESDYELATGYQSAQVSISQGQNLFDAIEVNTLPFYSGDQDNPEPVTQSVFLDHVLRRFNARLYKWGNWKIESLERAGNAWDSVLTITESDFISGMIYNHLPESFYAKLNYKHDSRKAFNIPLRSTIYNQNGYSDTIAFNASGQEVVRITGSATAQTSSIANFSDNDTHYLGIRLYLTQSDDTTYYWNNISKEWRTSFFTNEFEITPSNTTGSISAFYNLEAINPPSNTATLTLELSGIFRKINTETGKQPTTATQNQYLLDVQIDNINEAGSDSVSTHAINENSNANSFLDLGQFLIGDAIIGYTPNAIRDDDTRELTTSWTNNVNLTAETIDLLTLRTALGYHSSSRKIIRASLHKVYNPTQYLSLNGAYYRFAGGTFDGSGLWTATWIEMRYEDKVTTFSQYLENSYVSVPIDYAVGDEVPLEVSEVTGDVEITYPKPKAGEDTQVLISWEDIVVTLNNGTTFSVDNGFYQTPLSFLPQIFYYDVDANKIKAVERTVWLFSNFSSQPTKYAKLFSIEKNEDVDGLEGSIVVPFAEEIAKTLFTRIEITQQADLTEAIWDYKSDYVAKLKVDYSAEINRIKVEDVRVPIPRGSKLSIISGDEEYVVTTATKVDISDTEIFIDEVYVNALKGSIIKYHNSYNGAQLLIQPSSVYITAKDAKATAESSLDLVAQTNYAVVRLNADVYGSDNTGLSAGLLLEVNNIKSRAVLQVDNAGRLATIELGSGEKTSVKISADDIQINGSATFYSTITQDIINGTLDVPVGARTISSAEPPAERPDGGILRAGDIWFDTSDSGKPYRYNGTDWIPSYTTIDGGNITTGSIKAAQIDVDDLFAENIKVTGSLIAYRNNAIIDSYVKVNSEGLVAFYDGIKTFDIPTNGTPRFLSGEIENVIIKVYETTQTEIRTGDNVETDGGLIFNRFGLKAYDTTGVKTVDITRQGDAYFKGQLDADQGTLQNLSVIGDIAMAQGGQIIIGNNMLISQLGITGDNINIDSFQVSVNQPSGETYGLSVNGIIATNASGSRRVAIEDTGIFITRDSQVVSLTANATTGALESNKGFKGAYYTSSGVAGVTQTVSNPTSITVTQGIITAIS